MGGGEQSALLPEGVEFLLGSEMRVQVLATLAEGHRRQATIARECDVGRSTAHRIVTALQERHWVAETDEGYALTAMGDRVLSAYRSFADSVACVTEHEPLFRCFEGTGVSVPEAVLGSATLTTATEHDPHCPLVTAAELLRDADADRVRTAWSGVSPITNSAGEDHLAVGNDVEMVVDRRTLVASRDAYFENYQLALASDQVDLLVTEEPLPAGVLLADDSVAVTGSRDGRVVACLHGDAGPLRTWAEGLYESFRSRADPVEVRYPMPGTVGRADDRRARPAADGGRLSRPD